jgi:hypothetical protein
MKYFIISNVKKIFYTWNDENLYDRTVLCVVNKLDTETWENKGNVAEISSAMEPTRRPVFQTVVVMMVTVLNHYYFALQQHDFMV